MIQPENEKVFIEHCQGCINHAWCTKHDESKYKSYYENCKARILVICPEVQVLSNQIPMLFKHKFTDPENNKPREGKLSFPRIGAFEIYFKDKTIFSKLESGVWPQSNVVASKIREILDQGSFYVKNDKSINVLKKRKIRLNQRNSNSVEPEFSTKIYARVKSTTPTLKKKDLVCDKKNKIEKKDSNEEYSDDFFKESDKENDNFISDLQDEKIENKRSFTNVYELVLDSKKLSNKVFFK